MNAMKNKKQTAKNKEAKTHSPADWGVECFSLPPQLIAAANSYGGPAPLVSRLAGRSLKREGGMTTVAGINALFELIKMEACV